MKKFTTLLVLALTWFSVQGQILQAPFMSNFDHLVGETYYTGKLQCPTYTNYLAKGDTLYNAGNVKWVPLREDSITTENTFPTDLRNVNGSGTFLLYYKSGDGCSSGEYWGNVTSDTLDLTTVSAPTLMFDDYTFSYTSGSYVKVFIKEASAADWDMLDSINGNSRTWNTNYYDLSAYAGQQVVMRFLGYISAGKTRRFFALDNFGIIEANIDIVSESIDTILPLCANANSSLFSVNITNNSNVYVDSVDLKYFVNNQLKAQTSTFVDLLPAASKKISIADALERNIAGLDTLKTVISFTIDNNISNDTLTRVFETYYVPSTPAINVTGDSALCNGNELIVSVIAGIDNYIWNTTVDTNALTIKTAGKYSVKAISDKGCQSAYSDTLTVSVNPLPATPTINVTGDSAICNGDELIVSVIAGIDNYIWNTTADTNTLTVKTAGKYSVKAVSTEGCESGYSDTLTVTVNSLPSTPSINTINNDSLAAVVSESNITSYYWIKDDVLTLDNDSILDGGLAVDNSVYAVYVKDVNGCFSDTSLPLTHIIVNINEAKNTEINIYPNPASDFIKIEGANGLEIAIVDILGNTILRQINNNDIIPISHLPKGTYFIVINNTSAKLIVK